MNKKISLPKGIVALLVVVIAATSCNKDFLEKPQSNDVTIDTIFSTKIKAQTFLWDTYNKCVPQGFPFDWGSHNGMYACMLMAASDEGDLYDAWPSAQAHNEGSWGPNSNGEDDFGAHYKGIRNASIFIGNIGRVSDMGDTEKSQMAAEAKVLRALQYHELMKRYGAVPIVDKPLSASDDINLPRNTYEECVNFVVKECDDAASVLPNTYSTEFSGRVTKGAALALKARVLLYAASPLHNTQTPYKTEKRELTGYANFSAERWKLAADASKAVLDWAQQNNLRLVTQFATPAQNYESAVTDLNTSENILSNQAHGWWGAWSPMFQQFAMPRGIYGGWYGHGVTFQHAVKYQKTDGADQQWPDQGTGAEFLQKMQQMEPRFQASVYYAGAKWNDEIGVRTFFRKKDNTWSDNAPVNGVGYMKKFLTRMNWGGGQLNWIVFRLAESYLNYAEALNEYSANDPLCYTALNEVRKRAGVPEITAADPRYDTQDELRQAIRRERAVELAFEEHRFFDVRRWQIAGQDGVMKGQMLGLNLYEQPDNTLRYRKEAFETRVWDDKMYLYPFPQGEIDKRYLTQNPGW